jgi:hypothetical protein
MRHLSGWGLISKTPVQKMRHLSGWIRNLRHLSEQTLPYPTKETLSEWADWRPMGKTVYGQTCIRRIELVYGQTFFQLVYGQTAEHRRPPKSAKIHRKAACTMAMAAELLATAPCLEFTRSQARTRGRTRRRRAGCEGLAPRRAEGRRRRRSPVRRAGERADEDSTDCLARERRHDVGGERERTWLRGRRGFGRMGALPTPRSREDVRSSDSLNRE